MHHQKSKIVDNLCDMLLTFRKLVDNFGDLSLQLCDIPASRKEEADSPRVVRKTAELEQQLGDCYSRFQAIGEPMKPVPARGCRQGRSLVKCRHELSARSRPSAVRVVRTSPLRVWRWCLTRVARQPRCGCRRLVVATPTKTTGSRKANLVPSASVERARIHSAKGGSAKIGTPPSSSKKR
jgi:hypothetical protein